MRRSSDQSPPDNVTSACGRHQDLPAERKQRLPIRSRHDFRTRLAGAVGVLSTELICLAVPPGPFVVLVNLVGRDADNCPYSRTLTRRLKQVSSPHDVGSERLDWVAIRSADQWLSRQMKDDLRSSLVYHAPDAVQISDISVLGGHSISYLCSLE